MAGALATAGGGLGKCGEGRQAEHFLTSLKKRYDKTGDDSRLQGTVLGRQAEDKGVVIEGGSAQRLQEWTPRTNDRAAVLPDSEATPS